MLDVRSKMFIFRAHALLMTYSPFFFLNTKKENSKKRDCKERFDRKNGLMRLKRVLPYGFMEIMLARKFLIDNSNLEFYEDDSGRNTTL
jgi:hypothetical protein